MKKIIIINGKQYQTNDEIKFKEIYIMTGCRKKDKSDSQKCNKCGFDYNSKGCIEVRKDNNYEMY